jgi:tetratricopeptide (TPR) repeat protein
MNATPISRRRRILFRLICISFPLLLFALAEGSLRLFGWGGYSDFFRELPLDDGTTLVVSDTTGSSNYFYANRNKPGTNDEFSFVMPKPAKTTRIFLCGESAIKGFPQPRGFASGEFLEQMLQASRPDQNVEVINLGTTAVASFPVLDIVKQAAAYDPDLVILYAGNNEFFGAYGVASINRGMASPALMAWQYRWRSLAVAQALQQAFGQNADLKGRTLMEAMIGDVYIAPDSDLRTAATTLLHSHVSRIAEVCKASKIPLLICLPAANERGLAPMGDFNMPEASPERLKSVAYGLRQAMDAKDSPEEARTFLRDVIQQAPQHAKAHFLLAQCEESLGNMETALTHYRSAVDFDTMPWRPPTILLSAIKQAADENGIPLCDVPAYFRSIDSPAGIGSALMDDHVHPSLKGQYELARAFLTSLQSFEGDLQLTAEQAARIPEYDELLSRMYHNQYDEYGVSAKMQQIFGVSFMAESNPEALQRWSNTVASAESTMPPPILEVARKWRDRKTHAGATRPLSGMVGRELIREQKFDDARELFLAAQRNVPEYSSWHMEYVYFGLVCSEHLRTTGTLDDQGIAVARDELRRGEILLSHGASVSGMAERHMGRIHQLLGEFMEAIPYLQTARGRLGGMDLVATDQALILSYVKTGQMAEARRLARDGVEHSGEFRAHYEKMLSAIPAS